MPGQRSKQFGNDSKTSERRRRVTPGQAEETEIFHAQAQPLQVLRTSARVPAQVRHLPLVLPPARAARGDSRGFEVVLVTRHQSLVVGRSQKPTTKDKRPTTEVQAAAGSPLDAERTGGWRRSKR